MLLRTGGEGGRALDPGGEAGRAAGAVVHVGLAGGEFGHEAGQRVRVRGRGGPGDADPHAVHVVGIGPFAKTRRRRRQEAALVVDTLEDQLLGDRRGAAGNRNEAGDVAHDVVGGRVRLARPCREPEVGVSDRHIGVKWIRRIPVIDDRHAITCSRRIVVADF